MAGEVEYIFIGSKYCWRDENKVLQVAKAGDKVPLNPEQVQRLGVNENDSVFFSVAEYNKRKRAAEEAKAANPFAANADPGTPDAAMPGGPPKVSKSEGN